MKCPACQSENAYIGIIHVFCVNEHCRNYDPVHAVEVAGPKPSEPPPNEEHGQEYLWHIWDEMHGD